MKTARIFVIFLAFCVFYGGGQESRYAWAEPVNKPVQGVEQGYFSLLPDIPLMPNMREIDDQGFVFDKPEGRVIESVGFLSAQPSVDIARFYQDSLLGLGWNPLKTNGFQRGDEKLVLKVEQNKAGIWVRFQLAPVSREIRSR